MGGKRGKARERDIGRRIELEDERPFVIGMLTLVEIIELPAFNYPITLLDSFRKLAFSKRGLDI